MIDANATTLTGKKHRILWGGPSWFPGFRLGVGAGGWIKSTSDTAPKGRNKPCRRPGVAYGEPDLGVSGAEASTLPVFRHHRLQHKSGCTYLRPYPLALTCQPTAISRKLFTSIKQVFPQGAFYVVICYIFPYINFILKLTFHFIFTKTSMEREKVNYGNYL